jgi:phytol kinase
MVLYSIDGVGGIPAVVVIAGVVLVGIWTSNIVFDHGVPNYISRKIGHGAGGLAFLASLFFATPAWPIAVASGFGVMLLTARLVRPHILRGVGGTGRNSTALAEIWFPWVAVPVFAVSWYWFGKPEVSVSSLLFMAWGDGITGLVRSVVYHRAIKGLWGSLAMLCVCLVIAGVLIRPFWIGVVASIVAVAAERAFGDYGIFQWGDDNWAIPLASMGTILGLMGATGIL